MFKRHVLIVFLLMALFVIVGCETDPAEDAVEEPVDEPADEPENVMGRVDESLNMDGSSEGYSSNPIESAGALIYLAYDEDFIYVLMEAEVEGWLSIGFNESGEGMDGANMILGYLTEEGEPAFRDDVGRGNAHSEAETTAVAQPYFDRSNGTTVLEFAYPLSFPADQGYNVEEIVPGEPYSLIVGLHSSSDNIDSKHSNRGMVDFQVQP